MPTTIERPALQPRTTRQATPELVDAASTGPLKYAEELKPFGAWVDDPIWVPPKDSSAEMAESMLRETRPFTSREDRWEAVVKKHRDEFTQVRELDLYRSSIRLPQGKFFVTITEQQDFDKITDEIPACAQTRLDEFLAGPGQQRGVKVYYVEPLCVEVGDELVFTSREDLQAAIDKIQTEVFAEYRQLARFRRPKQAMLAAIDAITALPRKTIQYVVDRRQRAIDEYQARLEFKRRKTALAAARTHRKFRSDGCSFDEMLALTNPLQRADVVQQYCVEEDLSKAKREHLLRVAAGAMPWFMAFSAGATYASMIHTAITLSLTPPVLVCDPAFVAEMPRSKGVLLNIAHFDEVDGVTHVEL